MKIIYLLIVSFIFCFTRSSGQICSSPSSSPSICYISHQNPSGSNTNNLTINTNSTWNKWWKLKNAGSNCSSNNSWCTASNYYLSVNTVIRNGIVVTTPSSFVNVVSTPTFTIAPNQFGYANVSCTFLQTGDYNITFNMHFANGVILSNLALGGLDADVHVNCSNWSISPTIQSGVPSTGGNYGSNVSATGGCNYNVSTSYTWLHPTTYPGSFGYIVDANPTTSQRTGYINVNDASNGINNVATLTVIQNASSTYVTSSFTKSVGCAGQISSFTNTSAGSPSPNYWFWNFGDGGTSYSQNPTHIYTNAGNYSVSFYVSNSAGNNNISYQTISIPSSSVSANFNYVLGSAGQSTSFTDNSNYGCGSGSSWNWNFGDGSTSTSSNPSHTYSTAGVYNVSLTAYNNLGYSNTFSQSITINPSICIAPANPGTPIPSTNTTGPITLTRSGTPPAGITWYWQGPTTTCDQITSQGFGSTFIANATGTYKIRAKNDITNCWSTGCGSVNVFVNSGSLSVSSLEIPPWQRQDDDYFGSVTVSTSPTSQLWHLEVDVYNANGTFQTSFNYPSITGSTQNFFNTDAMLNSLNTDGKSFKFYAVLDATNSPTYLGTTKIIEKKWDHKNILYRDESDLGNVNSTLIDLKVPIKYSSTNNANNITIVRKGQVAFTLNGLAPIPKMESSFLTFSVDISTGYAILPASFLDDLDPGDFEIIVKNGNFPLESMYFDLTKYGIIYNSINTSDKIIVAVGGIFNEMENTANDLRQCGTPCNGDNSFSILDELKENNGIWYIAQGNGNSIVRNGYDVGKALEKIYQLRFGNNYINPNYEINILCHSKGGLDTRAYLQGLTSSYKGNDIISYNNSSISGRIKKVLFLGTPHLGAPMASVFIGASAITNCPGTIDLSYSSYSTIPLLNNLPLPISSNLFYLNLAGYKVSQPILGHTLDDGIVPLYSNKFFYDNFHIITGNNIKQLYQHSFTLLNLNFPHFRLHKKNYLTFTDNYHTATNCLSSVYPTNLKKIIDFYDIGGNSSFDDCPNSPTSDLILINPFTSILPNASIYCRRMFDTSFILMGTTEEYGTSQLEFEPKLQIGDSIKIEAVGCETVILPIDSCILKNKKLNIGMFKTSLLSNKVKAPYIKFINSSTITKNSSVQLEINGQNVINYQINSSYNQDTNFIPLTLVNNNFTASLDTGRNLITVRFIGSQDTVTLNKNIYFMPDTLQSFYGNKVYFNTLSAFYGTKIYIDNQFEKDINTPSDSINIFTGYHNISFKKFGYLDSAVTVKDDTTINIELQLQPISYSSLIDSSIANLVTGNRNYYWKNVSLLDSLQQNIIKIKQYDANLTNKGLISNCRKFEFRHLNSSWSNTKFSAILDQPENLCKDSIYLMRVLDDSIYSKIHFETSSNSIAHYDSTVQKLDYNYINFNNGSAQEEALVIMKKQPPILKNNTTVNIAENSIIKLPLSYFFGDPDSIKNDMTYQIGNHSSQLNIQIINDSVLITPQSCWNGNGFITILAQHDSLWRNKIDSIIVQPMQLLAPVLTSPGISSSTGSLSSWQPVFYWNNVIGSNLNYRIIILKSPYSSTDTIVNQCVSTNTYQISPCILEPSTNYKWCVQGNILCGNCASPISNFLYFNTPATTGNISTVVIGPTSGLGSSNYGPLFRNTGNTGLTNYSRFAYLYDNVELGIPIGSVITKVEWYKKNSGQFNAPNNFNIWLANTSMNTFSIAPNWSELLLGSSLMYSNSNFSINSSSLSNLEVLFNFPGNDSFLFTGNNLKILTDWQKIGLQIGSGINFFYEPAVGKSLGVVSTSPFSNSTVFNSSLYSDSRPTIKLTYVTPVYNTKFGDTYESTCDSFNWNGVTYTTSGVYIQTLTNGFGCTNNATLNLTINHGTFTTTTNSSCDSFTWHGASYTNTGTFIHTNVNSNGCVGADTLHLTLNNSTTYGSSIISSCDSYTWNGATYTESGVYNYTSSNLQGCTNTATLNLSIFYGSSSSVSVASCNPYTWLSGAGLTYSAPGVYTSSTILQNGCLHIDSLILSLPTSANSIWTWMSGANMINQSGIYGTKGIASAYNNPGARDGAVCWADHIGNLYLFGGWGKSGNGVYGFLNDLWKYNIGSGLWTWVSGDNTIDEFGIYGTKGIASLPNKPGSRGYGVSYIDNSGNLWLFGGYGYGASYNLNGPSELNDLWKFNTVNGQWTWMSGDSVAEQYGVYGTKGVASINSKPGARQGAVGSRDNLGNFWLYGGIEGFAINDEGELNDLWKYNPNTGLWTWMSGDNATNSYGNYGMKGIASTTNKPGARGSGICFADNSHNIWIFSGFGYSSNNTHFLNDLWKFNTITGNWTWMSGDSLVDQYGIYGTKGIASATTKPGARFSTSGWVDSIGNLWVTRGSGYSSLGIGFLNDMFKYTISTGQWTWIDGDTTVGQQGNYGTMGNASTSNKPGARQAFITWKDNTDKVWLFGGYGPGSVSGVGQLSDLWKYSPVCPTNLSVKLFIQGYYNGSGLMNPVLKNEGVGTNTLVTDSITIELHSSVSPYQLITSSKSILKTNGTSMSSFPFISGAYYIVIKHRNGLTTWSSTPILFGESQTIYDFSNNANKAYGNNMIQIDTNKWAIYSGDINSDENIDLLDLTSLEADITNFDFGYFGKDINGDGNIDLLDSPIVEDNINNFIFSSHP